MSSNAQNTNLSKGSKQQQNLQGIDKLIDLTLLKKVFFKLNAEDWHGYETEIVWAELVSGKRYRLRNTPFFAKNVSFEDIVFTHIQEGNLFFESTSIAAGHSTYRILVNKTIFNTKFLGYWQALEKLGCSYESADKEDSMLLAVDVSPNADIYKVYGFLDRGENDEIWWFEEGHCGHSV